MSNQKKRVIKVSLKTFFAFLSILIIPVYTIAFGTKESPFEYTLSNIGNFFNQDHNTSFIIWGTVTGLCFVIYMLYTFTKLDYKNKKARRYLIASNICLFLTVITPAMKDIMPFLHFMHVIYSTLFALFLVASIMLFIQYLSETNARISRLAFYLLLATVAVPVLTLFFMGLNGIVEILFFVCISIFLVTLNIILDLIDTKIPTKSRTTYKQKPNTAKKSKSA